jgi:hypothetical protein
MRIPGETGDDQERGPLLQHGSYNVRISGAKEVTSKNGTPGIEIDYSCDVGEIREWLYVVPKSRWKAKAFLEACGLPAPGEAFDLDVSTLVGKTLRIWVEDETYNGETRQRVAKHDVATRVPNVSAKPKAADDDDIPFLWFDPVARGLVGIDGLLAETWRW